MEPKIFGEQATLNEDFMRWEWRFGPLLASMRTSDSSPAWFWTVRVEDWETPGRSSSWDWWGSQADTTGIGMRDAEKMLEALVDFARSRLPQDAVLPVAVSDDREELEAARRVEVEAGGEG